MVIDRIVLFSVVSGIYRNGQQTAYGGSARVVDWPLNGSFLLMSVSDYVGVSFCFSLVPNHQRKASRE